MKQGWKRLFVTVAIALVGGGALAAEAGDWLVRVRAIHLVPDDAGTDVLATAEVKENTTIEVDVTRFFTDHFAVEAIGATSPQEITLGGTSLGGVHHLPPTVLAQYHWDGNRVRPYAGLGLNYTIFYRETGTLKTMEVDDSFGFAGQLGLDCDMGDDNFLNFDLKYINIETEVSQGGTKLGDLEVNPWVVGVGFGHRF